MSDGNNCVCPLPGNCPDNYGTLPSCAGLAVPYVPFQQNNPQRYNENEALAQGTLFPGLNLPFYLKTEGAPLPDSPTTQLQALEFVVLELGHYLDTHPDDKEAYALFQKYAAMEKTAKERYEENYGPLTRSAATKAPTYTWLAEPWPWNYQKGEV